ncbi:MAG: hypothetical protein AAGK04_05960 [Planctomycetota bacterium]
MHPIDCGIARGVTPANAPAWLDPWTVLLGVALAAHATAEIVRDQPVFEYEPFGLQSAVELPAAEEHDEGEPGLRLDWPVAPSPSRGGVPIIEPSGQGSTWLDPIELDKAYEASRLASPSLGVGLPLNDHLRFGAAGWRRSIDPDLSYFALSAEAQLTGLHNAGLWIGYDVYRDWLPDELPETELPREGMFVEFRMSF